MTSCRSVVLIFTTLPRTVVIVVMVITFVFFCRSALKFRHEHFLCVIIFLQINSVMCTRGSVCLSHLVEFLVPPPHLKFWMFCSFLLLPASLEPTKFGMIILTVIWRESYDLMLPFICQLVKFALFHFVAYSHKARIVESKELAVTRQRPVNKNRGTVFSTWSVPRCYK
jgi:hypothetical protein